MDPAFREEIKMALGAAAAGSGDEVSTHISSPSHTHTHTKCSPSQRESSLDDEAMEMVDEALAAVFKSRFASKHQNKQKKGKTTPMYSAVARVQLMPGHSMGTLCL